MGILVASTDFVNEFQLSQKPAAVGLIDQIITNHERILILELFGVTLGAAIITNIGDPPISDAYAAVIDPIELDDTQCRKILISEGLQKYLIANLYVLVVNESIVTNTSIGPTTTSGENSVVIDPALELTKMYNRATRTGKAIHRYIEWNPEGYDYSDFNGKKIQFMMPF